MYSSCFCPWSQLLVVSPDLQVAAAQAQAEERRSQSVNSPVSSDPPPVIAKAPTKPVIDGSTLKTVERQRLAKERREEREKEFAAKELYMLEKEKKIRLQYEKQMEERQRKLQEQRQKEQQKRVAVEEKRRQKQEEEKEHYEAVMRRTLERSQRLEQRQKRWSWGGAVATEKETSNVVDKRSTSTGSLTKQARPEISKRLSSSSTALPHSPDKSASLKKRSASLNRLGSKTSQPEQSVSQVEQAADKKRSSSLNRLPSNPRSLSQTDKKDNLQARRSQNSPLESNIISRLLTPTQSSLARSKSAAAISEAGQSSAESHLCPRSASARPVNPPNKPLRSRSTDRQNPVSEASAKDTTSVEASQKPTKDKRPSFPASSNRRRSPSPVLIKRPPSPSNSGARRPPSPSNSGARRPPSPSNSGARRPPSPPNLATKRSTSPSTTKFKQHPASPPSAQKPLPVHRPPVATSSVTASKKKTEKEGKPKSISEVGGQEHEIRHMSEKESSAKSSNKTKETDQKPGTTSAEEAARILAENRRLAREQKEREEQERLQLQEAERVRKEEQKKREAEERTHREAEAYLLQEERKLIEEQNQRKAEEERICREEEERERLLDLQLQREEAEAKALEEANRQRLERERITQQNEQERLKRKQRIAEVMKRVRGPGQDDSKMEGRSDNAVAEESSEDEHKNEDADEIDSTDGIDELQGIGQESAELSDGTVSDEIAELNGVDAMNITSDHLNKDQTVDVSPIPKEDCVVSELLHVNEVDRSVGHQNGKASTWILKDYIGLDICSKATKLAVTPCSADACNQNLIDIAGISESHISALEGNGGRMTSLTTPIEETSGL
ncbi:MAP7 domain-containing protein 2 isoform X7 [Chiloscyllium plagiosum]|uniref:MAP7 domain-containing protein 2 isoform X7 n=1 Tax=Chiloscyllium plagiosum TaxID=36176 RepID=UPI001CB86653|nr:MAP7 domain-containing protein 2 isoform X7 [Chiloscyllium plagiosum]